MENAFETLTVSMKEGVLEVALNRPRVVNAYNIQMRDEIWQVLGWIGEDPEVRAVLLRGEGERGFCAGADLTEFGTAPSQAIARYVRFVRPVWERWLNLEKPIVVALHGWVLGSGVEMALLCDLRVASEDAVFGMPEVALGMVPAAGGTQTLPRFVGPAWALEVLLTNRRVTAREALAMGLVQRVVARPALLETARSLARDLARLNPEAVVRAKRLLRQVGDLPAPQAREAEVRLALEALLARRG